MTKKKFDVAVIGSAGLDTNVYLAGEDVDFSVEANFSTNIDCVGGAGGYACKGFKRLNKSTAYIGFTGKDFEGNYIEDELKNDGIDLRGLFTSRAGTAHSVNIMYKDGRRKNFYDGRGSMDNVPDLSICEKVLSESRFAHFSIVNWSRRLLPLAKKNGLTVSVDIQDVVDAEDPYREDYVREADILFFSTVNFQEPSTLIERFLSIKKDRIVIAGMGKKGCAVGYKAGIFFYPPVELKKPVIDTNGAGDSFAVGFLTSYLLDGYSMEDSILRGQICARYCCTLKGTSNNLISRNDLDRIYKKFKNS